ncbi:hypothetical protein CDCA_CDCA05G1446 [Cyanidium caldarium]|uniref:4-alpha-glucanotransferase n=1 Tax=Cyanidium caldarium TaxID=2771 RepID=A0AAV9ITM7_CYACA|nr:hypothetical protein CDCA_CDCA05G1446 [Cyanidium caldarium]
MEVTFRVRCPTVPGQDLLISGSHPSLGDNTAAHAPRLVYTPTYWELTVRDLPPSTRIHYRYLFSEDSGRRRFWERGAPRELLTPPRGGSALISDDGAFRSDPSLEDEVFNTLAFRDVVYRRLADGTAAPAPPSRPFLHLQTLQVRVAPGEEVCARLGDRKLIVLSAARFPLWEAFVPWTELALGRAADAPVTLQYQLLIRRIKSKAVIAGDNNPPSVVMVDPDRSLHVCDYTPITPAEGITRLAGLAIPVFSLRSRTSCGVGEFVDLEPLVDLAVQLNLSLIQLLPLNDTCVFGNWRDCYPYSSLSVHALHPQYLNFDELKPPADVAQALDEARSRLNALPHIDYDAMIRVKMRLARRMYLHDKERFLRDPDFLKFFNDNQAWLVPYAAIRFLADVNGTADFTHWGRRQHVTMAELEELASPDSLHFDHVAMYYYLQYHLHRQLKRASEYAASNAVILKGDLPIGVHANSVDAWMQPHLFHLDRQTGAPPDQFAEFGQNWGFPTYNWDAMAQDDYSWWRGRLRTMAKYFHAYRIDHILGFFRIWEIPGTARSGLAGRFRPVLPLQRHELESRGLWDIERLCEPYISDKVLRELFGDQRLQAIRQKYFEPWYDRLRFKPAYATEKQLTRALEAEEPQPDDVEQLRTTLLHLLNNVVLLRDFDRPGDAFHPRIEMWRTSSFTELNGNWQHKLRQLYEDYFFRRQEDLWRRKALEKLPMMKSATEMLVCGEDLGMLPNCVFDVLDGLSILGLRVQRMPDDGEFGDCATYPYLTVATPSSHDTSTVRGWWEEMPADQRQRFWDKVMQRDGDAVPECTPDIVQWIVRDHLQAPSVLAIFPLQDLLGVDGKLRRPVASEEQINVPADPNHYWRFRLHLSLEQLLDSKRWLNQIAQMVTDANRARPQ